MKIKDFQYNIKQNEMIGFLPHGFRLMLKIAVEIPFRYSFSPAKHIDGLLSYDTYHDIFAGLWSAISLSTLVGIHEL